MSLLQSNFIGKDSWSSAEDAKLLHGVTKTGPHKWDDLAYGVARRSGKQCRDRWQTFLNPLLKIDPWSHEEQLVLVIIQAKSPNKWAAFSKTLLGRSDNAIKNYWNFRGNKPALDDLRHQLREENDSALQELLRDTILTVHAQYFAYMDAKYDSFLRATLDANQTERTITYLTRLIEESIVEFRNDLRKSR